MSRVTKKRVVNEHEQEVDEIIATCRGDLRMGLCVGARYEGRGCYRHMYEMTECHLR